MSRGFAVSAEQQDEKWRQRDGSLVYIRLDAVVCGTISYHVACLIKSYFQLLTFSPGITPHVLIWWICTSDGFSDATPKGFGSPPRTKTGIFCLLGECINLNTMI